MLSNHQDSLKNFEHLFHVSEEPGITIFEPRPSPSFFTAIKGDVVFAIGERLLQNYLLPRDCPRVTYYATEKTILADKEKFFGGSNADFVVVVESGWYERIKNSVLYCYEFPADSFELLDECAGYYISYNPVSPVSTEVIEDVMGKLLQPNVELRFIPSLLKIADAVASSTMNFSLIRMRNAAF
jgi:hypothetical protein